MTKKIKDLQPGDKFKDTFDEWLEVEKVKPLPCLDIPRTSPRVRVYLITPRGNRMYQGFRADREVEVA